MKTSGSIDFSGCLSRSGQYCGRSFTKVGVVKILHALRLFTLAPPLVEVLDPPLSCVGDGHPSGIMMQILGTGKICPL